MSDKSMVHASIEAAVAAERRRCVERVLTYAALRDQAAIDLDKAADGFGEDGPSEGAAERARHSQFFGRGHTDLNYSKYSQGRCRDARSRFDIDVFSALQTDPVRRVADM